MKKIDKIIIGIMLIAITLLEIGYAAMQNVTLNITGTATAEAGITLAKLTNDSIGDYIDLGNNIVGTESTSDDWRVLYVEDNTVYVILADYLPASQVPTTTGLDTSPIDYPYSVWSYMDRYTLLNGLSNTSAWNSFANGISGAVVIGSPTVELLMKSYNTKNETALVYTNYPTLDSSTADYDLYVPHADGKDGCEGYWFASANVATTTDMWLLNLNSIDFWVHDSEGFSIRPVVELPITTEANLINGIWKIL